MNELYEVITFAEACNIWGKGNSFLRNMINTNKIIEGKDYRKSNGVWLIKVKSMIDLCGEPAERMLFDEYYFNER